MARATADLNLAGTGHWRPGGRRLQPPPLACGARRPPPTADHGRPRTRAHAL